jgi:WD40 repeat protein
MIGDSFGQINVYDGTSFVLKNTLKPHSNGIVRIKQSPFININGTNYVGTGSLDTTVKLWNPLDWTLFRTYTGHSATVSDMEFINETTIASGDYSGQIQIWLISSGQTLLTINTGAAVWSLKLISKNVNQLAAGLISNFINIYKVDDGSLIASLVGHRAGINDLALLSNGLLASASDDYNVRIWNITTYTSIFTLQSHVKFVVSLKQVKSDILASASDEGAIKLWNITNGKLLRDLTGHEESIEWSLDLLNADTLVSGSKDKTIKFWNWNTAECVRTIDTNVIIRSLAVITTPIESSSSKHFQNFLQYSKQRKSDTARMYTNSTEYYKRWKLNKAF